MWKRLFVSLTFRFNSYLILFVTLVDTVEKRDLDATYNDEMASQSAHKRFKTIGGAMSSADSLNYTSPTSVAVSLNTPNYNNFSNDRSADETNLADEVTEDLGGGIAESMYARYTTPTSSTPTSYRYQHDTNTSDTATTLLNMSATGFGHDIGCGNRKEDEEDLKSDGNSNIDESVGNALEDYLVRVCFINMCDCIHYALYMFCCFTNNLLCPNFYCREKKLSNHLVRSFKYRVNRVIIYQPTLFMSICS